MLPQNKPDRIRILFDDDRLVANAGLLLPATLARHLGLRELVDHHLDLGGAPGRANTGDKMMTLVASALAGGDCIDDAEALRAGGTVGVLGCTEVERRHTAAGGGNAAELHKAMVDQALHGYDVQLSAIHFAATSLAMLNPDIQFDRMNLYVTLANNLLWYTFAPPHWPNIPTPLTGLPWP